MRNSFLEKVPHNLELIIGEQYVTPTLFYATALYGVSKKVKEANPIPGTQLPTLWLHTCVPAN